MESQDTSQSTKGGTRTRGPSFNYKEDKALTQAWLHVGDDGVVWDEQAGNSFWGRVLGHFHIFLGNTTDRNAKGLSVRWSFLQGNIQSFHAILSKLEEHPPSGVSHGNIVELARQAFFVNQKTIWKWQECYDLVKDNLKWKRAQMRNEVSAKRAKKKAKSVDGEGGLFDLTMLDTQGEGDSSTPATVHTPGEGGSVPFNTDYDPTQTEGFMDRPIGKKQERERRTKEKDHMHAQLEKSIEAINEFVASFQQYMSEKKELELKKLEIKREIELEKIKLKRDQLRQREEDIETRIIAMKLDGLGEDQRRCIEIKRAKIMHKWATEGKSRGSNARENGAT